MDDDFIKAINTTADTSFDASVQLIGANVPTNCNGDPITCPVVLNLLAKPLFVERLSGSVTKAFLPGEGKRDGAPLINQPLPKYFRMHCTPNDEDKRGAWQLQAEYLEGRLGKNKEENSRLWNTVIWIDKHYRVVRTPAEALPPLNIYVGDKKSQSMEGTGAPTGSDDEAPDKVGNEGIEFESINVGEADGQNSMCVMQEDGTTHRLEIRTDDYDLMRLVDELEEIDKLAKIDVNDLMREGPPILPQIDFPGQLDRAESGKIIRMLMVGLRTLWRPVICAIADHATMKSLGQSIEKMQVCMILQNNAHFPMSYIVDELSTSFEGMMNARPVRDTMGADIPPLSQGWYRDAPIDVKQMAVTKQIFEGHIKFKLRYGLPGNEKHPMERNLNLTFVFDDKAGGFSQVSLSDVIENVVRER